MVKHKSRLKEIRQGTGLTIDQVVEATGISKRKEFIVQIAIQIYDFKGILVEIVFIHIFSCRKK